MLPSQQIVCKTGIILHGFSLQDGNQTPQFYNVSTDGWIARINPRTLDSRKVVHDFFCKISIADSLLINEKIFIFASDISTGDILIHKLGEKVTIKATEQLSVKPFVVCFCALGDRAFKRVNPNSPNAILLPHMWGAAKNTVYAWNSTGELVSSYSIGDSSIVCMEAAYGEMWIVTHKRIVVCAQDITNKSYNTIDAQYHEGNITFVVFQEGTKEMWSVDSTGIICIWNSNHRCLQFINVAFDRPVRFGSSVSFMDRHKSATETILFQTDDSAYLFDATTLLGMMKRQFSSTLSWCGVVQMGDSDPNELQQLWFVSVEKTVWTVSCPFRNDGMKLITDEENGIWKYVGQIDKPTQLFSGYGEYAITPEGSKRSQYFGFWEKGKRNGFGVELTGDGVLYQGMWKGDLKNGYGVLDTGDGTVYAGNFANGIASGFGSMYFPSGQVLKGRFEQFKARDCEVLFEEPRNTFQAPKKNIAKTGKSLRFEDKFVPTESQLFPNKWGFVRFRTKKPPSISVDEVLFSMHDSTSVIGEWFYFFIKITESSHLVHGFIGCGSNTKKAAKLFTQIVYDIDSFILKVLMTLTEHETYSDRDYNALKIKFRDYLSAKLHDGLIKILAAIYKKVHNTFHSKLNTLRQVTVEHLGVKKSLLLDEPNTIPIRTTSSSLSQNMRSLPTTTTAPLLINAQEDQTSVLPIETLTITPTNETLTPIVDSVSPQEDSSNENVIAQIYPPPSTPLTKNQITESESLSPTKTQTQTQLQTVLETQNLTLPPSKMQAQAESTFAEAQQPTKTRSNATLLPPPLRNADIQSQKLSLQFPPPSTSSVNEVRKLLPPPPMRSPNLSSRQDLVSPPNQKIPIQPNPSTNLSTQDQNVAISPDPSPENDKKEEEFSKNCRLTHGSSDDFAMQNSSSYQLSFTKSRAKARIQTMSFTLHSPTNGQKLSSNTSLSGVAWGRKSVAKETAYFSSIKELQLLPSRKNAYFKARTIISTVASIISNINEYYYAHPLLKQPSDIGADDIQPIMTFIVIKANVPDIHAQLCYINQFSDQETFDMGEMYQKFVVLTQTCRYVSTILLDVKDSSNCLVARTSLDSLFFDALSNICSKYESVHRTPPPTIWLSEILLKCASFVSLSPKTNTLILDYVSYPILCDDEMFNLLFDVFSKLYIDAKKMNVNQPNECIGIVFRVLHPPHLLIHFSRLIEKNAAK